MSASLPSALWARFEECIKEGVTFPANRACLTKVQSYSCNHFYRMDLRHRGLCDPESNCCIGIYSPIKIGVVLIETQLVRIWARTILFAIVINMPVCNAPDNYSVER